MIKHIVKSGKTTVMKGMDVMPVLENTLNKLAEDGYEPINITQSFIIGDGWVFSVVAKKVN